MYSLNFISAYLKLHNFISTDFTLLNKSVSAYNYEELPLCIVPVLSLCYTGLADIYAELSAVCRFHKLREASTVIAVHFKVKDGFLYGQIAKVC